MIFWQTLLYYSFYALIFIAHGDEISNKLKSIQENTDLQKYKISDTAACLADVKKLCENDVTQSNYEVIKCLQEENKDNIISDQCQHLVWNYKLNITLDIRFDSIVLEMCGNTLEKIEDCKNIPEGKGMVLPCLIDNYPNITDMNCLSLLDQMKPVIFSNYHLIYHFTEMCGGAIDILGCGRLAKNDRSIDNQGKILHCLSLHYAKLDTDCKREMLRVAELQADDYHNDRQLYFLCRDDREKFCETVKAGQGRVYKCLFRHKFEREMSEECRKILTIRQQLAQENYMANKGLAVSCKHDILKHHCLRHIERIAGFPTARMSAILVCLEGSMRDGKEVSSECISELKEVRTSLMEDFQINPTIVALCSNEIQRNCEGGLNREGKTIHCLLDLARQHKTNPKSKAKDGPISSGCIRALEDLMETVDVGDNYEVDPALKQSCDSIAKVYCHDVRPGYGRVMDCLMSAVKKPLMTDECRENLMEIYYFISRDFRLDPKLYKECRKDAQTICQAPKNWHKNENEKEATAPQMGYLVFACLYRHVMAYTSDPDYLPITRMCASEVKRVMKERALTVDLDPSVEENCLDDLAQLCSEKTEKSEEMACLEDNLTALSTDCRKVVSEYASNVDRDPTIDEMFIVACQPFWKEYCPEAKDEKDEENDEIDGDLMQCLITHKHHPDMNNKCQSGILHHQLIMLKEYRFSHKLRLACSKDIETICSVDLNQPHNKSEVVSCLSAAVMHDTMFDEDQRVTKKCRRQLTFELLQRNEDLRLDPELAVACQPDVELYCGHMAQDNAVVVNCLKRNQPKLTKPCHTLIFRREEEEAVNPLSDYYLVSRCKAMIKKYCVNDMYSPETLFSCLVQTKDETEFDRQCAIAITKRQELRALDIRLNPTLKKSCEMDAKKFCFSEIQNRKEDEEDDGAVILCLRKIFGRKDARDRLSDSCDQHLRSLIRLSAANYLLDRPLANACKNEIKEHCLKDEDISGFDRGKIEACLQNMLNKVEISNASNPACYQEVLRIVKEANVDLQADYQLYHFCALDANKYCDGISQQLDCLIAVYQKGGRLEDNCNRTMGARIALWKRISLLSNAPDSLMQIADTVVSSPAKNYFLGVFIIFVLVIFVFGLFCGRVTKKVRREIKNR